MGQGPKKRFGKPTRLHTFAWGTRGGSSKLPGVQYNLGHPPTPPPGGRTAFSCGRPFRHNGCPRTRRLRRTFFFSPRSDARRRHGRRPPQGGFGVWSGPGGGSVAWGPTQDDAIGLGVKVLYCGGRGGGGEEQGRSTRHPHCSVTGALVHGALPKCAAWQVARAWVGAPTVDDGKTRHSAAGLGRTQTALHNAATCRCSGAAGVGSAQGGRQCVRNGCLKGQAGTPHRQAQGSPW